jgi:hypothetical protein
VPSVISNPLNSE